MATFDDLLKISEPRPVNMPSRISERSRRLITTSIVETCTEHELLKVEPVYKYTFDSNYNETGREKVGEQVVIPWGNDTTDDIFGGLSVINSRGKMHRRIRNNLFRNFNIKFPTKEVAMLGNLINEIAEPMGVWYYLVTNDVESNIGRFGDAGSCFRHGNEVYAIQEALDVAMALVYDMDSSPYARAWVHNSSDDALVFFNAYSRTDYGQLRTRQIAGIIAKDMNKETRKVYYSSNLYQNQEWAIAIAGEQDTYEIYVENCGPECGHCNEYIHEEDEIWIDGNDFYVCSSCFSDYYFWCDKCDIACHDDEYNDIGDTGVCDDCRDEYFSYCNDCDTYVLNEDVYELNDDYFCSECYDMLARECASCCDTIHRDDAYLVGEKTYCENCCGICARCENTIDNDNLDSNDLCEDCVKETEVESD